jgi:Family of unknown function (DUF6232)
MTMPPLGTAQIIINRRTLQIGHQTYQLQSLARVQTLEMQKPDWANKGNKALAWLAALGFFVLVGVILAAAAGSGVLGTLGFFGAIVVGVVVYQVTKKPYTPLYGLFLETAGSPMAALWSPDRAAMENLARDIVAAIENPPQTPQVINVGGVVLGDQVNQYGNRNVGKVGGAA